MTKREFKKANEERLRLVGRLLQRGLSTDETSELERLSGIVNDYMVKYHPRDRMVLDEFGSFIQEMRAKING